MQQPPNDHRAQVNIGFSVWENIETLELLQWSSISPARSGAIRAGRLAIAKIDAVNISTPKCEPE
jgi:hypothetical protein